jgi:hypothetical protein
LQRRNGRRSKRKLSSSRKKRRFSALRSIKRDVDQEKWLKAHEGKEGEDKDAADHVEGEDRDAADRKEEGAHQESAVESAETPVEASEVCGWCCHPHTEC